MKRFSCKPWVQFIGVLIVMGCFAPSIWAQQVTIRIPSESYPPPHPRENLQNPVMISVTQQVEVISVDMVLMLDPPGVLEFTTPTVAGTPFASFVVTPVISPDKTKLTISMFTAGAGVVVGPDEMTLITLVFNSITGDTTKHATVMGDATDTPVVGLAGGEFSHSHNCAWRQIAAR